MVKLFKVKNKTDSVNEFCFAPNELIAIKTIIEDLNNKKIQLFADDITDEYINEDGVKYLIENNFIGIPERSVFMLNGCGQSMQQHYEKKERSSSLFWSKKVPGSKEIWS